MKVYITQVLVDKPKGVVDTTFQKPRLMTKSYWAKHYNWSTLYSLPNRLSIRGNQDDFGFELDSDENLSVLINCDLKFNKLVNFKVQLEGVSRNHNLHFENIYSACWHALFKQFNFNPTKLLIKEQGDRYTENFMYMTRLPDEAYLDYGLWLTNKELKEKVGCSFSELYHTFLSMRYLNFVDAFNGIKPVQELAVAPIYEDYKSYSRFVENVVIKETRVKEEHEFAKSRVNNTKTYLNRAVDKGILNRFGTGKSGGMLTQKAVSIIWNYVYCTNQDKRALKHILYEVEL